MADQATVALSSKHLFIDGLRDAVEGLHLPVSFAWTATSRFPESLQRDDSRARVAYAELHTACGTKFPNVPPAARVCVSLSTDQAVSRNGAVRVAGNPPSLVVHRAPAAYSLVSCTGCNCTGASCGQNCLPASRKALARGSTARAPTSSGRTDAARRCSIPEDLRSNYGSQHQD